MPSSTLSTLDIVGDSLFFWNLAHYGDKILLLESGISQVKTLGTPNHLIKYTKE